MKSLYTLRTLFNCFLLSFTLSSCQLTAQDQAKSDTHSRFDSSEAITLARQSRHEGSSTSSAAKPLAVVNANELYDFGDLNFKTFLQQLKNSHKQPVHIIQFGDSHTAADFFSGELRQLFQAQFGDGGVGLVPPAGFNGIRQDTLRVGTLKDRWKLVSSRTTDARGFPPGGYLATLSQGQAEIGISSRNNTLDAFQVSLLYNSPREARLQINEAPSLFLNSTGGAWKLSRKLDKAELPFELKIQSRGELSIGALFLTQKHNTGVIYSALGVNGATESDWDRWDPSWPGTLKLFSPNMIVLAYGTNEATNASLDTLAYRDMLRQKIRTLRAALPHTAILLIGAPDSLRANKKRTSFDCEAQRPANLANIIDIQRSVAREERILYWDWQAYMGGLCAMHKWNKNGLARDDLVHFTAEGYRQSARALYQSLKALGRLR